MNAFRAAQGGAGPQERMLKNGRWPVKGVGLWRDGRAPAFHSGGLFFTLSLATSDAVVREGAQSGRFVGKGGGMRV